MLSLSMLVMLILLERHSRCIGNGLCLIIDHTASDAVKSAIDTIKKKKSNLLASGITRNIPDTLKKGFRIDINYKLVPVIPYLCFYSQNTSKFSQRTHSSIPTVNICGSGWTCIIRLWLWNKPYSKWIYWMHCVHTAHPHWKNNHVLKVDRESKLYRAAVTCSMVPSTKSMWDFWIEFWIIAEL